MKNENEEKIAGLEAQIGPRGSAEIHSGKRSALRAWLMAKTGRTAANILYLGTAALGEIYNDKTDAKLNALKLRSHGGTGNAPEQTDSGKPGQDQGQAEAGQADANGEAPEAGQGEGEADGEAKSAPKAKAGQGEGGKAKQPDAAPKSGNPIEDRMREIAREEDARVIDAVNTAIADAVASIPTPEAGTDEAKVREIAAEEAAKQRAPERVIIVTPKPEGEARKDMGVQHRMFPLLLATVRAGLTPALVGPAGSGKTHAAHAVASALGLPFELQGTCTTASSVVGYQDANGRYVPTPFYRSFAKGGVFLGDEMDAWHANAALAMNAALANGHAAFPEGMIARHADFRPIMAMNTYGTGASRQYVGRNQMDAATLNRLAVIDWNYDDALTAAIVGVEMPQEPVDLKRGGIPTVGAWLARVFAVGHAVDALKVRHIVSPRAVIGGVKLFAEGVGQYWAEEMLIWQGMDAEQRARVEAKAGGR